MVLSEKYLKSVRLLHLFLVQFIMPLIQFIQERIKQINQALSEVDQAEFITSLPFVMIEEYELYKSLPTRTAAIYFLTHPELGMLYIGKAKNLRMRWAENNYNEHDCLEIALQTENVRLSWWEMPSDLHGLIEESLIRLWQPKWNGHTGKGAYRQKRDNPDPDNLQFRAWVQSKSAEAKDPRTSAKRFKGLWRK